MNVLTFSCSIVCKVISRVQAWSCKEVGSSPKMMR